MLLMSDYRYKKQAIQCFLYTFIFCYTLAIILTFVNTFTYFNYSRGGRAYETLRFSQTKTISTGQFFVLGIFQFLSWVSHIIMEVILFKIFQTVSKNQLSEIEKLIRFQVMNFVAFLVFSLI